MKKHISKILYSFSLILFSVFSFSSCDGVIFSEIRNEVKLADAEIGGMINSIIRYNWNGTEYVFIANGGIKYRSVADDVKDSKISWSSIKPSGATSDDYFFQMAADSQYLYAMAVTFEEDDDGYISPLTKKVWSFDGNDWTQIFSMTYSDSTYGFIFCTNSENNSYRKAFLRYGSSVYELSNSTLSAGDDNPSYLKGTESYLTGFSPSSTYDSESETLFLPFSCASIGETVVFSTGNAMTSNNTYVYRSSGDVVSYSTDGNTWTSVDLSCDTILSLTVTSDYLIAGTDEGIVHTPLTSGVPSSGTSDFDTNAESTLSSYYEVRSVLALDSTATETGGTIFASAVTSSSSASRNNIGLWSYFASTGEWNRE